MRTSCSVTLFQFIARYTIYVYQNRINAYILTFILINIKAVVTLAIF